MLSAPERQAEIAQSTRSTGHVSVSQLANHFGVTPETIRRDLKSLELQGHLVRVHGGAVTVNAVQGIETEFNSNAMVNMDSKRSIAEAAWNRIKQEEDLSSLTIDSGTTAVEFARVLASNNKIFGSQRLTIITNSLPVATVTTDYGINGVHLVGGRIRPITRAVVGDHTVLEFERLRTDFAIMGTNGLSINHGCSTPDPSEAAVKSAMIRSARKVMVLCDSSKFKKDFLVTFASLDAVDVIVTDENVDPNHVEALVSKGIEVVIS
ncbi:Glucitol operon repressor [Corynebacterium kalinowskii]|uniref:Lactose phosphotransferase system repressor n=1 Tax=Corynebacterium kalinowskii TaxID=2675216 RepID=A0A6B8W455_9CORY|nr:DeoR/GlpR family DNA-binding transcription regulator [Corynebacterium kalinowskii]QGU02208.1 Glucitol operon repressor [Corynebacterium kalinowskii]